MLTVITGSMYSGKTEELIKQITRYKIAGYSVLVLNHESDTRYADSGIVTHQGVAHEAKHAWSSDQVKTAITTFAGVNASTPLCIALDEAQFFDKDILHVMVWASHFAEVIVAGLNRDAHDKTFGAMGDLLAQADRIVQLYAVCTGPPNNVHPRSPVCGQPATHTLLVGSPRVPAVEDINIVDVGSFGKYVARCRSCYIKERGEYGASTNSK